MSSEWYARTRFAPIFNFEVGRTKAVLALEIDLMYGQGGANDGGFPGNVSGTNSDSKAGTNGSLDSNTDVGGMIEIKWIYTEFDLTGKDSLMPFIAVPTVARLGGQPYSTLANYKVVYANGDFAGISAVTTWAPNLKTNFAYVQVEEEIAGGNRLQRTDANRRGNDFAVILSADVSPFKGLDIKPLYSYFYADGATASAARRPINNQQGAVTPGEEHRHTIGADARWRAGPFSLDPTLLFQFGERSQRVTPGSFEHASMTSWLVDVLAGFQLGPLLLEARGAWTPGNHASDDLRHEIRYFEPLNLDTGYWSGPWAAIIALGIDSFNGGGGTMQSMPTNIGYDRYGRRQLGLRATYSLTPALAFWGTINPTWSDKKVDTDTGIAAGGTARTAPTSGGDSRYIGTEVDLGMTWRFAPNTVFDLQGAYLAAGSALDTADASGSREAKDAWLFAARMRFSF